MKQLVFSKGGGRKSIQEMEGGFLSILAAVS